MTRLQRKGKGREADDGEMGGRLTLGLDGNSLGVDRRQVGVLDYHHQQSNKFRSTTNTSASPI